MAASIWPEIKNVRDEKRHELVLHGADISRRIDSGGVDDSLFLLEHLNLLEIFKTTLKELPHSVGQLSNLTSLVLHSNQLTAIPDEIGKLTKLKLLDLSFNQITSVPKDLDKLVNLETLNLGSNRLELFPDNVFESMVNLHVVDLSHNQLTDLPEDVMSPNLEHLLKLQAQDNGIERIPDGIANLISLKHLDLSNNALKEIPPEMSECSKLKELFLKGNKLKDRRLMKLIDQCHAKSVMDYLANLRKKELEKSGGKGAGKGASKKQKKKSKVDDEVADLGKNVMEVLHFQDDRSLNVKCSESVLEVRPYILCCVVKGLDFLKSSNMFKGFISLQNKLHEEICDKRHTATIATHDLKSVMHPLLYDARSPVEVKLVQLFKHKSTSAARLVTKLREEAEAERKAKKRNTFSGIHKYLNLLNGFKKFPFIFDAEDDVISFPPITNCEKTKITQETTDLLIEVTSTVSLDTCKSVMEALLTGMLNMGCGSVNKSEETADEEGVQKLTIEQVKILNPEGQLKVVYPSRTDLSGDQYRVIRDYD
ncbi:leucine-rich repeat-containing protein 47-like [Tubulanus polymorphus]|uniref:leucine-rich repeat-containing protein 47-like n=1 Tax=Tubulanus polymorphus TaxID=672921 RepID=UPI003DA21454